MVEPVLTRDGQEALDSILNRWPPIIRQRRKEKISRTISLMMTEKGAKEATRALVIEAAKFVISPGFTPFFDMMEDMEKFKRISRTPYIDLESYYAMPRHVKRWEPTLSKPPKLPEAMKVLAFNASPREGGNTDALIDEALRGASNAGAKVEKISLQALNIKFCTGCRGCKDPGYRGYCVLEDKMHDIYPKIVESDAIIIGFPIYTGRECAQLSTFLDRWDCFEGFIFGKKLEAGRRAMVIGTWGYNQVNCYDHIIEHVMTIMNLHQIQPVEALSACGFAGKLRGLDENGKAIVLRFPGEMKKAYQAGRTLVTGEQN